MIYYVVFGILVYGIFGIIGLVFTYRLKRDAGEVITDNEAAFSFYLWPVLLVVFILGVALAIPELLSSLVEKMDTKTKERSE